MATAAPAARTATRTSTSKPAARCLRWLYRHPGLPLRGAVRLALTYARRTDLFRYWVEAIPSDWGTAFRLERIDPDGSAGETYHVCVAGPADSLCGCKGFEAHGHCKHLDACRVIAGAEGGR